jgi:hypothetical protein
MTDKQRLTELEAWLPQFFTEYHIYHSGKSTLPVAKAFSWLTCQSLEEWFCAIEEPLKISRLAAFQCDPWDVAGLGRDEVRNSSVLAWLLNPNGSHGLGDAALKGLLVRLNQHFCGDFPTNYGSYCSVCTESNPDGELTNRVDIEIDSENFYLIIEVKINALERDKQLEDYGDLAQNKAYGRPWALVFLTLNGIPSKTAGKYDSKVLPISWKKLSHVIGKSLGSGFLLHDKIKGQSRVMTEQLVMRFIKRMHSY